MADLWKPNVTVAAVIERDGRFLFVEEQSADGLRYNQPAGHLEAGESLVDAAVRETLEETACEFSPQGLVGIYQVDVKSRSRNGDTVSYLRVAVSGTVGDPIAGRALDEGIVRALWLTYEQIAALTEQHRSALVMRCLDDYRNCGTAPLERLFCHPSVGAGS
jgi:ADP-ribose pyrophosphatase YjhB (NUDIX family)